MNLLDITNAMFLPTLATREMLGHMLRTIRANMVESSQISAAQAAALLLWLRLSEDGDMQSNEPEMQPLVAFVIDRVPPGNLWGWRQLRKTIKNEHDFGLLTRNQ